MVRNRAWRAARADAEDTAPMAIITGAGRGIGCATAEAFAAENYAMVIAELHAALGRRVEQEFVKAGRMPLSSNRRDRPNFSGAMCAFAASDESTAS